MTEKYTRTFSVPVNGISIFLQILKAFLTRGMLIKDAKLIYDFEKERFISEILFDAPEDYILFHNVIVAACSLIKSED